MNTSQNLNSPLLADIPRGVAGQADLQALPVAAWADPQAILNSERMRHEPGKFLLGSLNGELIGIHDPTSAAVFAGTRGGKSAGFLIPNMTNGILGSIFCYDCKAELSSVTAEYLESQGIKVFVLDPYRRGASWIRKYDASFNALEALQDELEMVEQAGQIADGIVARTTSEDNHWSESAVNLIAAALLHVRTYPRYEGERNLITVRRLLTQGVPPTDESSEFEALWIEMASNKSLDGHISGAAISFANKNEKELASILSVVERNTHFLSFKAMRSVLEQHDFDLSELKTSSKGIAVFLCLPVSRMNVCNRWVRLMINLAFESLEKTRVREDAPLDETGTKRPVVFYLDELPSLQHLTVLPTAVAQMAGFGAKLVLVCQDVNQLEGIYGKSWQTLIGNCGIQVYFAPNDPNTQQFLSRRLGQTTVVVRHKSNVPHSAQMAGGTGENFSTQLQDLLAAEETGRFLSRSDAHRRMVVMVAGKDPMILQRPYYFDTSLPEHRFFEGKFRRWV